MADTTNLSQFLTDIADSIRTKRGTTDVIPAANFDTEIAKITTGVMTQEEYNECLLVAKELVWGEENYTSLEYITGRITLDFDFYYQDKLELTLVVPQTQTAWTNVVDCLNAKTRGYLIEAYGTNTKWCWFYNGSQASSGSSGGWDLPYGEKHTIMTDGGKAYQDGVLLKTVTTGSGVVGQPRLNASTKTNIYEAKFWHNNILTHHLVPMQHKDTLKKGMYDKVTGVFIEEVQF